jgi:hypothetical protein
MNDRVPSLRVRIEQPLHALQRQFHLQAIDRATGIDAKCLKSGMYASTNDRDLQLLRVSW